MSDDKALQDAINLDEERRKRRAEGGSDDQRPVIKYTEDKLAEIVDAAEDVLVLAEDGLYRQGQRIVRPVWDTVKLAGGNTGNTMRLHQAGPPHLIERLTAVAQWRKWSRQQEGWVPTRCPEIVAGCYLARKHFKLPYILGIVTAPTLRSDGSLLDVPGYDQRSGILYEPQGVVYPTVEPEPTREEAEAALEFLKRPFSKFTFSKPSGLSIVLSAVMTVIVRRAMPVAPMHAFSAPTAGSGKSMLVNVAAVIGTGERASVISTGGTENLEELEKRVDGSQLAGDLVLSIDNVETPLGGDFLCQAISEHMRKIRPLGGSDVYDTPNPTCFFATGNNLSLLGDMTRRALVATLAVEEERPELRRFDFDPVELGLMDRPAYVAAALTVMRAYIVSGERVEGIEMGSFHDWARLVRDPLIWLGEADPVQALEESRATDPRLARIVQVMDAWEATFGDAAKLVKEVVTEARATDGVVDINADLHEALLAVGSKNGRLVPEMVSWWLRKNAGRVVGGRRFEASGNKYIRWTLIKNGENDVADIPF